MEEQPLVELDKELQRRIRAWGKMTRDRMLLTLAGMGVHERVRNASKLRVQRTRTGTRLVQEPNLRDSIRYYLRKYRGQVDTVSLSFARHGIFLEHGVGKYRPRNSPEANAAAKRWLSVSLNDNVIEQLADIIEDVYGEAAERALTLIIPGVLTISTNGS